MEEIEYTIEGLNIEKDGKYILVIRGFDDPASLDHVSSALRGVFPNQTPIFSLRDGQSIELLEVGENDTLRIKPPTVPAIVGFLKEVYPNSEIIN